ncbi:I5P1-like protein [Mya arenaria]|uniref:inositol-polyphosphate 5-phosphatase n=1 Tax=Mya arenaria TaxID=6604 RepID=A0ABY7FKW6_MYAAR|nr:I5P1-like protein [Mya arenaria]
MEVDRVDSTKLLLVTANVGSIFEDSVRDLEPGMLAIHCQEVGGKNYEASMQHALGNLYFIHECVEEVSIYDFIGFIREYRKHSNQRKIQISPEFLPRFQMDLTEKTEVNEIRGKKNQISKLTYTDANSKVVLTVESKYFDHHEKHNEVFRNKDRMLNKYDKELEMYKDRVFEFDFTFPPSYPFSEDVSDGLSYMKTRCPSWCDRILLSHTTAPILVNPVYLLLWLRKGKGNQQAPFDTQTSFERRKKLSKKISINGETIDFQKGKINIHDYANFEKSEELIPEFRLSIKTKQGSSLKRQHNISGDSAENSRDAQGVTKKPSFHEIAQRVLLMESALMKWPNRPRTRHHSSSSEDLMDSDEETNQADREPDQDSVHTDVSDLPADTEDLKFELSHSSPSSECGDVKRNAVSKKAIKNENNSKLHLRKTVSNTEQALFEKNQSDLHEKCSVEHEHEIKKMSSGKQESVSPTVSPSPEQTQLPMATEVIVPGTQVKISEVDTTKYIHIRQNGTSARVFRETSV